MKTAVSIPDDVFESAERMAQRDKKSRSQLYSDAVREYVARHEDLTEAPSPTFQQTESMTKEAVEQRNGGYYVAGSRVSLDSVVYAYLQGESPNGIVESFPSLTLEQVFGACDFYLANRVMVEDYLREQKRQYEVMYQEARKRDPAFYEKLDDARRKMRAASF